MQVPREIIDRILGFIQDYTTAIFIELLHVNISIHKIPSIPSLLSAYNLESHFPFSARLTEPFTLFPHHVNPSTTPLPVLAWLFYFRKDIFTRRCGLIVRGLAAENRLDAIKLIANNDNARRLGFEWGELDAAAENGHLEMVQYLHSQLGIPITPKTLAMAAKSGNLRLLHYVYDISKPTGTTNFKSLLNHAFGSGNKKVVKFVIDNYPDCVYDPPFLELQNENSFPELESLILATYPQYMASGVLNACKTGSLSELTRYVGLNLTFPKACLDKAAQHGHLDIVIYLLQASSQKPTPTTARLASQNGHLHVLQHLVCNFPNLKYDGAFQEAGTHGHLHIVQYMHEYHPKSCKNLQERESESSICPEAFMAAVIAGNLSIVEYLHFRCSKFSQSRVTANAVLHGHIHVLQYLAPKTDPDVIVRLFPHCRSLEMLEYLSSLHSRREMTKPEYRLRFINMNLAVIQELSKTYTITYEPAALDVATARGDFEIFKYLLKQTNPSAEEIFNLLSTALSNNQPTLHAYLLQHLPTSARSSYCPTSTDLENIIRDGSLRSLIYAFHKFPTLTLPANIFHWFFNLTSSNDPDCASANVFEFLVENPRGAKMTADPMLETMARQDGLDAIRYLHKSGVLHDISKVPIEMFLSISKLHVTKERVEKFLTD
ncbi:hypothetical protein HDU97_006086 [Phlyctochytrium planicorne]|nr:hypothetical protein HDU97_006086 [Phlyctochytrium planicorne]